MRVILVLACLVWSTLASAQGYPTVPCAPGAGSWQFSSTVAQLWICTPDGLRWATDGSGNVVTVQVLADFPAPVAGVITLAANTTYVVNGTVDLGTNRIVWGARSALMGTNRVNDALVYNGTGIAFTVGAGAVVGFFHEIGLRAPTGMLIGVSGASVSFIDVGFGATLNGGNIALSGAFSFGLRTSSMVSAFTGSGFTFTGTSTSACRIFDNLARNNAGTMFAFGSAAFAVIDIGRNVVDSSAGQTFVSGLPAGANVTQNGIVVSNSFVGAGVGIATITGLDPKWIFRSNAGAADTPVQSVPVGGVFIADVPTNPNTLLGYGTWSSLPSIGGLMFWKRTA